MITILFWFLLALLLGLVMTIYRIFWFVFVPFIWLKNFLFWSADDAQDWIEAKLPWLMAWVDWALGD